MTADVPATWMQIYFFCVFFFLGVLGQYQQIKRFAICIYTFEPYDHQILINVL